MSLGAATRPVYSSSPVQFTLLNFTEGEKDHKWQQTIQLVSPTGFKKELSVVSGGKGGHHCGERLYHPNNGHASACVAVYESRALLKEHKQTFHGLCPVVCPAAGCGMYFSDSPNTRRHYKSQHTKKGGSLHRSTLTRFMCGICGRQDVARSDNLKRHIRQCHKVSKAEADSHLRRLSPAQLGDAAAVEEFNRPLGHPTPVNGLETSSMEVEVEDEAGAEEAPVNEEPEFNWPAFGEGEGAGNDLLHEDLAGVGAFTGSPVDFGVDMPDLMGENLFMTQPEYPPLGRPYLGIPLEEAWPVVPGRVDPVEAFVSLQQLELSQL